MNYSLIVIGEVTAAEFYFAAADRFLYLYEIKSVNAMRRSRIHPGLLATATVRSKSAGAVPLPKPRRLVCVCGSEWPSSVLILLDKSSQPWNTVAAVPAAASVCRRLLPTTEKCTLIVHGIIICVS